MGLNDELDRLEKDENVGTIAAYINESWAQKINFATYIVAKYAAKDKDWKKVMSGTNYFMAAFGATVGLATTVAVLQNGFSLLDFLLVSSLGYGFMALAFEKTKEKQVAYSKNALDDTIAKGKVKQYLSEFYASVK